MIHKITHERIDLDKKDLREILSLIYGKRTAKMYIDRGYKLALRLPKPIIIEEK